MQVHGAIIPPRAALDAVSAVVRSVPETVEDGHGPAAHKGMFGRLGRHKADAVEQPDAPAMLEHVPVERMYLPITGFGNLTSTDVHQLTEVIAEAASGWAAPTVRFGGGTALEFPGDWSVWAKVDGDIDALSALARGVTQSVESLAFFVDRRVFRPMLSVATVTPATTGPYLQQVVDALDGFRGEPWTADVALMKDTFVDGKAGLVEFHRISLG